jgi:hypothetical protein
LLADLAASHATVAQLEELPVLRQELKQTQADAALKDKSIAQAVVTLAGKDAELVTCKKIQTDADTVCAAKLKEQAAVARKRSLWYSVGAFIGGILAGRKL